MAAVTIAGCEDHGRGVIVVYSSWECPVCALQNDAQSEIDNLKAKIEELEVAAELKEGPDA
jgi:hypothetical protein